MKTVSILSDEVQKVFRSHSNCFSSWPYGKPVKAWYDKDNNLCVYYSTSLGNSRWFHYGYFDGVLEWW